MKSKYSVTAGSDASEEAPHGRRYLETKNDDGPGVSQPVRHVTFSKRKPPATGDATSGTEVATVQLLKTCSVKKELMGRFDGTE